MQNAQGSRAGKWDGYGANSYSKQHKLTGLECSLPGPQPITNTTNHNTNYVKDYHLCGVNFAISLRAQGGCEHWSVLFF